MLDGWYKLEDGNEDGLILTSLGRHQFWVKFQNGEMVDATHPDQPWASYEEAVKLHPWLANQRAHVGGMVRTARRYETKYWGGKTAEQLIAEAEARKNQTNPALFLLGFAVLSAALLAKRTQIAKRSQHEVQASQRRD